MEFFDLISSLGPRLLEWTGSATSSHWSLAALALVSWGDGFFPPLPSGTLVSALGAASASSGNLPMLLATIVIASTFALAGDMTMVAIGRRLPADGDSRFARLSASIGARAEKHWDILLSTSRFIPVLRVAVFLAAGAQRVPLRRIVLLDGIASVVWAGVYTVAGSVGGSVADHPAVGILIGMAIGALAGTLVGLIARHLQQARASRVDGPAAATAGNKPLDRVWEDLAHAPAAATAAAASGTPTPTSPGVALVDAR